MEAATLTRSPAEDHQQQEPRREPFTAVPTWLIRDPSITAGELRTYAELLSYAWCDPGCFPALPTLAADLGACENTVRTWIRGLQDKGLVVVSERPGFRTRYYPAYNPAREGKLEAKRRQRRQEGTPSNSEGVRQGGPEGVEGRHQAEQTPSNVYGEPPQKLNPTKNHRTNNQSYSVGPAEPPNGERQKATDDQGDNNDTEPQEGGETNVSTRRAKPNEVKELVGRVVSRLKASGITLTERQRSRIGGELKTVRAKRGSEALESTVEALIEAWERGEALYPLVAVGISKAGSGSPANSETSTSSRAEGYEWCSLESSTDPDEEARRREAERRREGYEWLFGE